MTIQIVHLRGPDFAALAAGRLPTDPPVPLTPHFLTPDWSSTWRRRARQVAAHPADAAWVTGIIWDDDREIATGRAGFHASPDERGMVEIGYAVDPAYRRQGYARAALEILLARAKSEPTVRVVRVTVRPDNTASLNLIKQYPFVEVGEQWDDEDGLEIVLDMPAKA
ncbi:GNAT family N-acetyltransferase [Fodinicola acaciae]|uniref:GNAT family N-acetyltransferase n=1 Tax=Fodinicola acaciae TaxID=2681555 RepID=UPI001FE2B4A7|nr:GNAT family N-acetyltransferase [Fodinicola acaciae]